MISLILSLIFLSPAYALKLPAHSTGQESLTYDPVFSQELQDVIKIHQAGLSDQQLTHEKSLGLQLKRFDLQLGLTTGGDMGVLSVGAGSALEFIWEKNEVSTPQVEYDLPIELHPHMSSHTLYHRLYRAIDGFIGFKDISPSFEKKIIKTLKEDAEKITALIEDLLTMPRIGNWYVGGFFKNYHFSTNGSLLGIISLGYAKRIRFRFSIPTIPLEKSTRATFSLRQKKMAWLMKKFNSLADDLPRDDLFQLDRIWAIHTLSSGFDLGFLEMSFGKGVQVAYLKVPDSERYTPEVTRLWDDLLEDRQQEHDLLFQPLAFIHRSIVRPFSQRTYHHRANELELRQIRVKYETDNGLDFVLATIEKNSTFQFHYRRSKRSP